MQWRKGDFFLNPYGELDIIRDIEYVVDLPPLIGKVFNAFSSFTGEILHHNLLNVIPDEILTVYSINLIDTHGNVWDSNDCLPTLFD